MAFRRLIVPVVLAAAVAVGLSACGRKGPLDLPPGDTSQPAPSAVNSPPTGAAGSLFSGTLTPSATPEASAAPGTAQDTAAKTGFDMQGNPVAAAGQKRPFILDPLLQ